MNNFTVEWVWRSRDPARNPPDPRFPYGIKLDVSKAAKACCRTELVYPAPGVGSWMIRCETCKWVGIVTAAGRFDDPISITVPCKQETA